MNKIELIGEIGTNHNGSIDTAFKLIDLAADANLDTIKLQIYDANDIVSPLVKTSFYGVESKYKYWHQYINNKLITPKEWLEDVISYSKNKNLDIITTVHSIKGAEFCLKKGIKRLKIASMDCNYYPFLKQISDLNVPVLLSTGMANKYEIMKAVDIFYEKNIDLTLFHCTATYPTKYEEANISFLNFLKSLKPNKLGLSDHSENSDLVLMSIPYGVNVIEKHITICKKQSGPDHNFALDYKGMTEWRNKTDNALLAIGSDKKFLSKRELDNRNKFRRKPILKKRVRKRDVLQKDNLYFARPENIYDDLVDIENYHIFLGMQFLEDVKSNSCLRKKYFIP